MAVPEAADRSGEDGDAAFALLRVAVGDGGPVVDLAALVGLTGQEEDPLGDGGLARVHVGQDAQVADGADAGQNGGGSGGAGGGDGVVRTADVGAHGPVPFEVERGAGAARLRRRRARPCRPRPVRIHPANRPASTRSARACRRSGTRTHSTQDTQGPGHSDGEQETGRQKSRKAADDRRGDPRSAVRRADPVPAAQRAPEGRGHQDHLVPGRGDDGSGAVSHDRSSLDSSRRAPATGTTAVRLWMPSVGS